MNLLQMNALEYCARLLHFQANGFIFLLHIMDDDVPLSSGSNPLITIPSRAPCILEGVR